MAKKISLVGAGGTGKTSYLAMLLWQLKYGTDRPDWVIFAGENYTYINDVMKRMTHEDYRERNFPHGTIPGSYPVVSILIKNNARRTANKFELRVLDYAGEQLAKNWFPKDGVCSHTPNKALAPLEGDLTKAGGLVIMINSFKSMEPFLNSTVQETGAIVNYLYSTLAYLYKPRLFKGGRAVPFEKMPDNFCERSIAIVFTQMDGKTKEAFLNTEYNEGGDLRMDLYFKNHFCDSYGIIDSFLKDSSKQLHFFWCSSCETEMVTKTYRVGEKEVTGDVAIPKHPHDKNAGPVNVDEPIKWLIENI